MRKIIRFGRWFSFEVSRLDGNHHGPNFEPLRRTFQWARMGSYAKMWTLYVYGKRGGALCLMFSFPRWLGEWPHD